MKHLLSIALVAMALSLNAQTTEAPEDFVNKGNAAVQLKDYKGAFENYQKAFDLYEKQGKAKDIAPETIYNAGYCAHKANLHDDAITYLKKAIDLNVKEARPYQNLAETYKAKKDNEMFEKTLEEGLAKYPDDKALNKLMANLYVSKGNAFYKEGTKIKADANKSGLSQSDPDAYNAELEKSKAEFEKALPLIEKAYKYDNKNKNALKMLSNIYTALEREDDAAKIKAELDAIQK
ncbi:MAG: tetratricopeptide repeat protein [Salinivirgaceae bacterium]|nr:tetratricopeptide repeat protein [Salinivirgaceae bacterium]